MPAPVITASHSTFRFGSTPAPTFSATGSGGQIAWTATRGSFTLTPTNNGQQTTYNAVNQTEDVVITARDTSDNATSTIVLAVEMTFPYDPDVDGIDDDLDDRMNVSIAEDGAPSFTDKGDPQHVITFKFTDREDAEFNTVAALWIWHRKDKTWWIVDYSTSIAGVLRKGRFDSKLSKTGAMNRITYTFVWREAVPA